MKNDEPENSEFINLFLEKFSVIISQYNFSVVEAETVAQGYYKSQVVVRNQFLEIMAAVHGPSGDYFLVFKPLTEPDCPDLDIDILLNARTNDDNYYDENIRKKAPNPIYQKQFSLYFDLCANELMKNCEQILRGDFTCWVDYTKYLFRARAKEHLSLSPEYKEEKCLEHFRSRWSKLEIYVQSHDPQYSLTEELMKLV